MAGPFPFFAQFDEELLRVVCEQVQALCLLNETDDGADSSDIGERSQLITHGPTCAANPHGSYIPLDDLE